MGFEFRPTLDHLYRTHAALERSGKPFALTSQLSALALTQMVQEGLQFQLVISTAHTDSKTCSVTFILCAT